MLNKLYKLDIKFHNYFKNYDFHNLYKDLLNFCTVDLSAFYFDIRKDTLYCDPINSEKRNSCLKVLNIILDSLLTWFAPILSFTTEEIYKLLSTENKSIHLEKFIFFPESFKNDQLEKKWIELIKIRDLCNISIEEKRANKLIGSSLEAQIEVFLNQESKEIVSNIDFSELCITSKADLNFSDKKEIQVITKKAEGSKCPVCWKISVEACKRHL